MKRILFLTLCSFLLLSNSALSQETDLKPIGSWTEYLPFQNGTALDLHGSQLFCGTTTGLFIYNISDNSISRLSTVNRLNGINVEDLAYDPTTTTLIVIYEDLNIDLLKGEQTINISAIRDASLSNKSVNSIYLKSGFAYLSCGFGIVKLNLNRNEISETYQFANGGGSINVNASVIRGDTIYAATNDGLYFANTNSNLLDFNNWKKINTGIKEDFIDIFLLRGDIYTVFNQGNSDSTFVIDRTNGLTAMNLLSGFNFIDKEIRGDQMLLARSNGLKVYDEQWQELASFNPGLGNLSDITFSSRDVFLLNNFDPLVRFNYQGDRLASVRPEGPFQENIFDLEVNEGVLWAVPGGYDQSINNLYRPGRVYRYKDGDWTSFIDFNVPGLNGSYDILSVNSNPENPEEIYMGCWGVGLIEYKNGSFVTYDESNSPLKDRLLRPDWVAVGGTAFDEFGNLWVVNSYTASLLAVKTPSGSWGQLTFANLESGEETAATEIHFSEGGLIWVSLPFDNHILVLDNNGTPTSFGDDRSLILKQGEGQGNVPGIRGITMDFDLDNQLWIGTSDGIAVNYNPDNIFSVSGSQRDFERVLIDNGENVEILLAGTEISDIETDGANRKWVSTNGSGVYVLSPDGQEEISHFTTENSPLFSNNVLSLAIDDKSGEVYMATASGLLSYRSEVVSGEDNFSNLKVFPNPVREDYYGNIAIDGLMDQSRVKITDIDGRLVNELTSRGGRALWDGNDFNGERVSTGVYLIFTSALNEEESLKSAIGKILFIK